MAEKYTNLPPSGIPAPDSPEEEIVAYDNSLNSSELAQMLLGPSQEQIQQQQLADRYFESAAAGSLGAQQRAGLQDPMLPDEEGSLYGTDPRAVLGTGAEDFARSVKAGWGDLVMGTGDAINVVNAWINPSDPDPGTRVGDWMKKVGGEIQDENLLVISDDLGDLTFSDMFKTEFWTHKVSRLIPYAASFMIPYAGGSMVATRFSSKLLVGAAKRGYMGKAAKLVGGMDVSKKAKLLFGTNTVGGR